MADGAITPAGTEAGTPAATAGGPEASAGDAGTAPSRGPDAGQQRRRWETAAAKAALEKHTAELLAKTGGVALEDVIAQWTEARDAATKAAEASQSEVQRITRRAEKAESALKALEATRAELERELREHRLERPLREMVAGITVRRPQYSAVLLAELKARTVLAADGKSVHAVGDDGQPDPDKKLSDVLSAIVAQYPDLVTTPMPGHGSGPTHAAAATTPGNGRGHQRMSEAERRAIYERLASKT